MRIVFMGTPDFAVETLEALITAGYDVCCVVTQPDRQKGRGKEVQISPVKACALKHGLEVFQPERIRNEQAVEQLRKYRGDLFIVVAFGQILSPEILSMPSYGCVNVHASLLPKYRGAAPIQWAILDGEKQTGVTLQRMDEGIDTGDIIAQEIVEIRNSETGESLFQKLSGCGAQLLIHTLPLIENHTAVYTKQDHSASSYAKMLKKEMGLLDFNQPAMVLERKIRGLNPWPSAYTYYKGKMLKIWEAEVENEKETLLPRKDKMPGTVAAVNRNGFSIATGQGELWIKQVQAEGKKRMSAADFLLGNPLTEGQLLN